MISLRQFKDSDKIKLIEILNDPRVSEYLSSKIPSPYTAADADWWIKDGSNTGLIRAITIEDELVGCIGVSTGDFEYSKNGEIGYWLCSEHWGKGLATQAVNIITEEVFRTTEINRLYAAVFSGNTGSMRVLEKCNFLAEAILQQAIYKNGKFYDNHIFARLKYNKSLKKDSSRLDYKNKGK